MDEKTKPKAFTMDINHYEAIKSALNECGAMVTVYVKCIFETIKRSAEPQILRAVSGYKLIG